MQRGAEVKVGLIALLALALLAFFIFTISGYRLTSGTYPVCVIFDNAQGLQRGDPVMLAGVRIGEVRSVTVGADLEAHVILSIDRHYKLYPSYQFQIATSGLVQQLSVEVVPSAAGKETGEPLRASQCVKGATTPTISDLLAVSTQVLTNLRTVSELLRTTLSDQQLVGQVKTALTELAQAAEAAARLAHSTSDLVEQARPDVVATMRNARAASDDIRVTTEVLRTKLAEGGTLDNLAAMSADMKRVAARLDRITEDVSQVTGNAKAREDLLATLEDVRVIAASVKRTAADVEVVAAKMKEAAPAIPGAVNKVSELGSAVQSLREGLKPPRVDANFDIVYSPKASRSYSSAWLDIHTQPTGFLRLGVQDIGENTQVDAQLGQQLDRGVLRYGLFRSTLGVGFDFPVRKNLLTVNLFDPNHLQADVLLAVPRVLGPNVDVLAGVRDLNEDNLFVAGVRLRRQQY